MSVAALALPVVVAAMFLGTAWALSTVVLRGWILVGRRHAELVRTAVLVAALPWLAGVAIALGALLPGDPHTGQVLACHCLESMPSWLHLCPVHPERAVVLALPAAAVLSLLLPGRVRALGRLLTEPLGRGGGQAPQLVDLDAPLALLHGWLRPTLVVDRGLWAVLAEDERSAVLAHERGHLRRRDPQVLMALRLLLVVAPPALARRVVRAWLDRAELRADAEAARVTGDPSGVAAALLRCARLGASAPRLSMSWTGGALERRVEALLASEAPARPERPDLGVADAVVLVALSAAGLLATPWIHHQIEHLLNLSF